MLEASNGPPLARLPRTTETRGRLLRQAAPGRTNPGRQRELPAALSLLREPLVEGGRRDAGALAGQEYVTGHLLAEERRPRRHELDRAAARVVGTSGHVHQVLQLRAGDIAVEPLRRARGDLGE